MRINSIENKDIITRQINNHFKNPKTASSQAALNKINLNQTENLEKQLSCY